MELECYKEHTKQLRYYIEQLTKEDIMLAFSGGVDSTLLLYLSCEAAKKSGKKVYAMTAKTTLHPMKEAKEAERIANRAGAIFKIIEINELKSAGILENPKDRCYRCKKYIFSSIKKEADMLGIKTIMDGTNEDDLHVYRPGIRALRELSIISPLAETEMTKEEIRRMAEEYGLSVATKPSTPCLATRFPYGTQLTYEKMRQVENGEEILKSFGFYNVRLRVHDDIARIETDKEDFEQLLKHKEEIVKELKKIGYDYITLDLEGFRSGSMDKEEKGI